MKTSEFKKLKNYIPVRSGVDQEIARVCEIVKHLQVEINSEKDAKLWWEGIIERLSFYYNPTILTKELTETVGLMLNNLADAERCIDRVPQLSSTDANNLIGKYFAYITFDHAETYIKRHERRLLNNFITNIIKDDSK